MIEAGAAPTIRVSAIGAAPGDHYYLDLVQTDGEKAIASPVWVD